MATSRIHHLNCGTMCPPLARLVEGASAPWLGRARLVAHVLLLETPASGLVLVDTGYGALDAADPSRVPPPVRALTAPRLDPSETAIARVRALGFDPGDVRHIVVTHLDPDHAGGIADFPSATVHLHARELAASRVPGRRARMRYLTAQLGGRIRWQAYDQGGDDWFGVPGVRQLDTIDTDVALVPLFGHSRGHCGVAVRAPDGTWLLHAGDAYYHRAELVAPGRQPPLLRLLQRLTDDDVAARRRSQGVLRTLARERTGRVTVFSAHDAVELEQALDVAASVFAPVPTGSAPSWSTP